jgi:hypothetical protein
LSKQIPVFIRQGVERFNRLVVLATELIVMYDVLAATAPALNPIHLVIKFLDQPSASIVTAPLTNERGVAASLVADYTITAGEITGKGHF